MLANALCSLSNLFIKIGRVFWLLGAFALAFPGFVLLQQTLVEAARTPENLINPTKQAVQELLIDKTADPTFIYPGDWVTYTFVVSNTGQETISGIQVEDNHLGLIATAPFTLTTGEKRSFIKTVQVEKSTHNIVTATADLSVGPIMATAEASVTVITPSLELRAWATPVTTFPGREVTYHYQITNSGNITLSNIIVNDEILKIRARLEELGISQTEKITSSATLTRTTTSQIVAKATHPLGEIGTTAIISVMIYHPIYLPLIASPHQWQSLGQSPAEVEKFFAVARCGDHLFGGTDQGAYVFKDYDWQKEIGVPSGVVYDIIFKPDTCHEVYLTLRSEGLWHGNFHDNTWEWERVDGGEVSSALTIIIQDQVLYVGGDFGLKWSDNQGESWQTALYSPIIHLSSDPDTQTLLAAVWNDGVYYQDRLDRTKWHSLGAITDPLVYHVTRAANRDTDLLVMAGTQNGIFLWNGLRWTVITNYRQTTFTTAATDQALYAGQRHTGVIISRDGGQKWELLNTGLVMPADEEFQVRDIHIGRDGYLYIATTNGVWKWSALVADTQYEYNTDTFVKTRKYYE
jgi:hypothetical protein